MSSRIPRKQFSVIMSIWHHTSLTMWQLSHKIPIHVFYPLYLNRQIKICWVCGQCLLGIHFKSAANHHTFIKVSSIHFVHLEVVILSFPIQLLPCLCGGLAVAIPSSLMSLRCCSSCAPMVYPAVNSNSSNTATTTMYYTI